MDKPRITAQTVAEIMKFTDKWCPRSQRTDFINDLQSVIVIATKEMTDYMLEPSGVTQ